MTLRLRPGAAPRKRGEMERYKDMRGFEQIARRLRIPYPTKATAGDSES